MSEQLFARIACGILGLIVGGLIGFAVSLNYGVEGNESIAIILGFALTCSIILAFFYRPIAMLIQLLIGGVGGIEYDIDVDLGVDTDANIDDSNPPTDLGRPSPWGNPQPKNERD